LRGVSLVRTQFLSTAILLLAPGLGATPEPAAQPPNIVWLIADDVSPDLGAYGKPVRTPNLD